MKSLSHVQLFVTPWIVAYQAPRPWDFPGKSTRVGCYCLLRPRAAGGSKEIIPEETFQVRGNTSPSTATPCFFWKEVRTGLGCHFLLQCMKVKSESEVVQSCPTLSDSMDCSPPGSSVHGIFQARVMEWVAIAFSTLCLLLYYMTKIKKQNKI